jgi:hypothetical protein
MFNLTATALIAAIGNGAAFKKGRGFSAWLGIVHNRRIWLLADALFRYDRGFLLRGTRPFLLRGRRFLAVNC